MDIFPIPFVKMSGTGNDFILIDHRSRFIPEERQAEFARAVCRRMFSVGADGLIFIENSDVADFKWQFYNSDGSLAEMCGNGSRCAARFALEKGIVCSKTMCFETLAGIIEAEVNEDTSVRVQLTNPHDYRAGLEIELDGNVRRISFLNTGVPHAVIFVAENGYDVRRWGKIIRFHQMFAPQGANVNFVTVRETGDLLVRTYERGVEDETRACGTGAVAAAIIAAMENKTHSPVSITTSGGDELLVAFDLLKDGSVDKVFLTGPTRLVYRGELSAESLL